MNEAEFVKLEKLNAGIDVWMDEEMYKPVCTVTQRGPGLDMVASQALNNCFREDKNCTNDDNWQGLLSPNKSGIPITEVCKVNLDPNDELKEAWSYLFYAKLLRAKIQQKSYTDCYTRRLDDVAWYLEKHLPDPRKKGKGSPRGQVQRLTILYLMELSAASQGWEALGFSERARRVVKEAIYSIDKNHTKKEEEKARKSPYEFYELWARYNIGVAYFHNGYYRKAVLEFNRIIWQVRRWETDNNGAENLEFYQHHSGEKLLLLPAKLFRAEVQLKLQLAYHALDTLKKGIARKGRYKEIQANIIRAQAYQQMRRLDLSRATLDSIRQELLEKSEEHKGRLDFEPPDVSAIKGCNYPSLAERFFDILIEDHLQWLTLEGTEQKKPKGKDEQDVVGLLPIVKYGANILQNEFKSNICNSYINGIRKAKPYLENIASSFSKYFDLVEFNACNRNGYLQQVAKYLVWLARAGDVKLDLPTQKARDSSNAIAQIAKGVYEERVDNILKEEPDESENVACPYCEFKGIDLRRIQSEHYAWFTKAMLNFFNSKVMREVMSSIEKDKHRLIKRLLERERKDRDDLRIRDLELRYELSDPGGLLRGNTDEEKYQYARRLCWNDLEPMKEKDYLELLKCSRSESEKGNSDSYDFEQIMKRWDSYFLRHLKSPSVHDSQESGFYFLGLQRWNSSSPAKGYSLGGGYLLYHVDRKKRVDVGIAIDPGFDFVRNLFHAGFSLHDIDIVLISHAHVDHIRDLEAIVTLLFELKERGNKEKRVHVILSLGAYKRLEHIVEDPGFRYIIEPYIIDMEREIDDRYFENLGQKPKFHFESSEGEDDDRLTNLIERVSPILPPLESPDGQSNNSHSNDGRVTIEIKPTRAFHDDKTRSDSFGFVITLKGKTEQALTFGYTGDTKWIYPDMDDPLNEDRKWQDISSQYKDCNALVIHLGSLIKRDDSDSYSFDYYDQCEENTHREFHCESLVRDENHPYLIGMLRLLSDLHKLPKTNQVCIPLILIGEFGEELRGHIRADLVRHLQNIYHDKFAILPIDVGINVRLRSKRGADAKGARCNCTVWCVHCDDFVEIGEADFRLYGADHALYCVCKTCAKSTPADVLQNRLRQLYEVGIELRSNDGK